MHGSPIATVARTPEPGSLSPTSAARAVPSPARIGPNAVLQTLRALRELESEALAEAVAERARLPERSPSRMIPEAWFIDLVRAVRESLPAARAEAVLRRSGQYTADYVGANRIPGLFRGLLGILPGRLGVPLLLAAFRRHAWTFAGGGRFRAEGGLPGAIVLEGCPTCLATAAPEAPAAPGAPDAPHAPDTIEQLAGGAYYEAAFQGLLALAAPGVVVREVACRRRAAPACRFEIALAPASPPSQGAPPCASS